MQDNLTLVLGIASLIIGLVILMAQIKLFGIARDLRDIRNIIVAEARSRGLLDEGEGDEEPAGTEQQKS